MSQRGRAAVLASDEEARVALLMHPSIEAYHLEPK